MPAVGELLAGRYRILGTVGAGGMATVHRAHDERLDRDVAVKVLSPNLASDPVLATRFDREARALAAAAHPGVVQVYDVDPGDPGGGREPFFVMELCPGGSLADRLAGGLRLVPDELVPVLVSVAEGLADLHARGVVHRDVKPSNILLAPERAKLADFGLARSDGADLSDLTTPGTAVGTLAYLAPELLAGESATAAADMYALGVVAFVGLSGTLPRQAGSLSELIATAHDPAARVSEAAADLGDAFDEPIAQALDPDPARRPEALTFATALTTALGRARRTPSPVAAATALPNRAEVTDDATTIAIPTAAPQARRPSDPGVRPGRSSRRLVAMSVVVVLAVLAVGLFASNQPRTGSPTESTVPPASAIAAPSTTAVPSPRASQLGTPPIGNRALATLDEVDAAIADTTGRDGLKGNERNELEGLAGEVRAALGDGDLDAASEAADALADKVSDVGDELDDARAGRLTDAVAALVETLGDD